MPWISFVRALPVPPTTLGWGDRTHPHPQGQAWLASFSLHICSSKPVIDGLIQGRHVIWTVCGARGFCWVCRELDVTLGAPAIYPVLTRRNLPETILASRKVGSVIEKENSYPDDIIWALGLSINFASNQPCPRIFYELINKSLKKKTA